MAPRALVFLLLALTSCTALGLFEVAPACVEADFFRDEDGDGFGGATEVQRACAAPRGYVRVGGDCDDRRADVHPGLDEQCDGVDNNCVGGVDEGADAVCTRSGVRAEACRAGRCDGVCEAGRGDCDRDWSNGCEVALGDSFDHCGACDLSCGRAARCRNGLCLGTIVSLKVGSHEPDAIEAAALGFAGISCAQGSELGVTYCWGSNDRGQRGTSTAPLLGEWEIPGLRWASGGGWTTLGVGGHSTCTHGGSSSVTCMGGALVYNPLPGDAAVRAIVMTESAPHRDSLCALAADASVYCWGGNAGNLLGLDERAAVVPTPRRLVDLQAIGLAMSPRHACAYARDRVSCWGSNARHELGLEATEARVPTLVPHDWAHDLPQSLAVGDGFSCATVDRDGARRLLCWGSNRQNHFGLPPTGTPPTVPAYLSVPTEVPHGEADLRLLTAGATRWCVGYGPSGEVYCAGGVPERFEEPRLLPLTEARWLRRASSIALGPRHACAVLEGGDVGCWGANDAGQLGDGSTNPRAGVVHPRWLRRDARLYGARGDFLALRADGRVFTRDAVAASEFLPFTVVGLTRGGGDTCFLTAASTDTMVQCFRREGGPSAPIRFRARLGVFGQLRQIVSVGAPNRADERLVGIGSGNGAGLIWYSLAPAPDSGALTLTRILSTEDQPFRGVPPLSPSYAGSPFGEHICAWGEAGAVNCWGSDRSGQSGGPMRDAATRVRSMALGAEHTCAILRAGGVRCWGALSLTAAEAQLDDAVEIVAGARHTCALRRSRRVACWGLNGAGQLGDGTFLDHRTPVEVRGLDDAEDLFAGAEYTCARRMSGQVVCWGRNDQGQLDDGTTEDRNVPTVTQQFP